MHDPQFPLPPENPSSMRASRANFLSEFAALAAHLPPNELRKAKLLYLENAIADHQIRVENNHLYSRIIAGAVIALIVTILIDTFFTILLDC